MTADDNPDPAEPRRVTAFLSYARADRARAARLAEALAAHDIEVWWDAMIEGGAAFAASIRTQLDAADAVIVLWSPASVDSDWVRDEAAVGRDRHCIVPVSLDGTAPPLGFRQYHVIDLSHWRGRKTAPQIDAIIRAVRAAAGQPRDAAPKITVAPSRRTALKLGGAAVAAAAGGFAWQQGWLGGTVDEGSIVVLPFDNLSGNPAQAYFSDGLTDAVRSTLARDDRLKVLAATSSKAAAEKGEDAVALARTLGVAFLLEGSVQRSADMVRIAAQLTDGRTGFTRWSDTLDRAMTDVFAIQTELAGLVASALSVQLATDRPAPGGTQNVAAYEAYLRGKAQFEAAKDEPTDRAALAEFDRAITLDGEFALAHAARARSIAAIAAEYAHADQLRGLYDNAIASARRAVALADDLAPAHLALGYALFVGRLDARSAAPSYDRAFQLGHGSADILLLIALYRVRVGRGGEARAAIARAMALDPINPRTHRAAGSIEYGLGRYAAAIPPLRGALALNPKISNAHALIGGCLLQQGELQQARTEFLAEPNKTFRLTGIAVVEHRLGRRAAAEQAMAQLVGEVGEAAAYQQAEVFAQWGRLDAAAAALVRARASGDSGLLYLTTDPLLRPLRKRPEFTRMATEMGLA